MARMSAKRLQTNVTALLSTVALAAGCGALPDGSHDTEPGAASSALVSPAPYTCAAAAPLPLADSAWPVIHHDGCNSDFTTLPVPRVSNYDAGEAIRDLWSECSGSTCAGEALESTMALTGGALAVTGSGRRVVIIATGRSDRPALHVVDENTGTILWESSPYLAGAYVPGTPYDVVGRPILDSCAAASTPTLDRHNRVFISDCHYLWSFALTSEGTLDELYHAKLVWGIDKNENGVHAEEGCDTSDAGSPLLAAMVTRDVGGVYMVGGVSAAGVFQVFPAELPAGVKYLDGPSVVLPLGVPRVVNGKCDPVNAPTNALAALALMGRDSVWYDGGVHTYMLDAKLAGEFARGFAGDGPVVANAPVVLPDPVRPSVTRFYIPTLADADDGAENDDMIFYRIDYDAATNQASNRVSFQDAATFLGAKGSATTPDIYIDPITHAATVYVGDGIGRYHALDAETGLEKPAWPKSSPGDMYGSATTAFDDGTVYVIGGNGILAVDARTGVERWRREYDDIAIEWMSSHVQSDGRPYPANLRSLFRVSDPNQNQTINFLMDDSDDDDRTAMPGGIALAASNGTILVPLDLGYRFDTLADVAPIETWTVASVLVRIDRRSGDIVPFDWAHRWIELADVCDTGFMPTGNAGHVAGSYGATLSSAARGLWRYADLAADFVPYHPIDAETGEPIVIPTVFQNMLRHLPEPLAPRGGFAMLDFDNGG